jgi:hypothetical protein
LEEAQEVIQRVLPEKSKEHYEKEFSGFNKWREQRQVGVISEEVMLSYSLNINKKYTASSMWSKYSILKTTITIHKKISNYSINFK